MRCLKKFFRLVYPIGYVLAILSINPLQMRNLTIGMAMMLPHILSIFLEDVTR